jgi:hypothetical protein
MDSDAEGMVVALMEEEAKDASTAADDDEHMKILSCLLAMHPRDLKPRRGGSRPGRRISKPGQRLKGYCMLYVDYLTGDTLHGEVTIWRRFRMNKKLFLDIALAAREYDTCFIASKIMLAWLVFPRLRMLAYGVICRMTTCAWQSQLPLAACIAFAGKIAWFAQCQRLAGRMSSEHLVCFKPDFLFPGTLL